MDTLPHEKQIQEYIKTIDHLKKQNGESSLFTDEIRKLELKVDTLKEATYKKLTPWERVLISRHPARPHTVDYIQNLGEEFIELCGDRYFRDDHAIIGGLLKIEGQKIMVIGQEKGKDTESRVYRNFGMLSPEGFRKSLRLMKLAEKFQLPILSFLDSPGAYPGLEAEERGQGWAIAANLREMVRIQTPIIVAIIGEGCSGGALAMGVGDIVGMLEHAYYSVISPEGCASILWKDANKKMEAAAALKLNSEHLIELKAIDFIIKEPLGGAHHNPQTTYVNMKQFILNQLQILKQIPLPLLIEQRYLKFRQIGQFSETL